MKKGTGKSLLILFVLITLVSAFIFVPYLISDKAYVLGWDMRTLYSSNFESLRTMLHQWVSTGQPPFWSWSTFLGNDYYSSKLFYFQDVFDYPFAFTDWNYSTIAMIQTYLKFLTAGFCFFAYARYHRYGDRTCVLGSLIFTFSAYNLQTMMHPFFGSFFVFLPLYFLSIDRYIREQKVYLFMFMVFFLFVNNYYLFYSVSLFTILYFLWSYWMEHHNLDKALPEAVKLIGIYLIGLLLSGVVVLPEVLSILSNSRVGHRSSSLFYQSVLPYLDYLTGLFTPTSALANRGTPISSLYSYTSANNSVMAVFLWASSICTLLVPQLFTKKNHLRINTVCMIIITAIALIPILSSAMHGFSEPSFRWLASPSFLLLAMILPLMEDRSRIDHVLLKKCTIAFIILLAVSVPLIAVLAKIDLSGIWQEYWLVLMFLPTLALSGWSLDKGMDRILILSTVTELCLAAFFSFYGSPEFSSETKANNERSTHLMGAKDEFNKWLLAQDPENTGEFYRCYIDAKTVYWSQSYNYNLDFDIMGLMSYDSTYHFSANDLKKLAAVESYLPWTFHITDGNLMNLLSTKYAVVTAEDQVPFAHYQYFGDYYSLQVYENLDYIDLGKTYTNVISYDEYDSSDTSAVTSTVICHSEDKEAIQSLLGTEETVCTDVTAKGNYLYADLTSSGSGFAVLSVPYDKGWKITVNGNIVTSYEVNGGLTGIPVENGYNVIQMSFIPRGLKAGLLCSASGLILSIMVAFIRRKH